jgi:hypothetical protein
MVIEMLLTNDIQKKNYSNDLKVSKGNKFNYVHYSIFLKHKFESFHLNKISIRY